MDLLKDFRIQSPNFLWEWHFMQLRMVLYLIPQFELNLNTLNKFKFKLKSQKYEQEILRIRISVEKGIHISNSVTFF